MVSFAPHHQQGAVAAVVLADQAFANGRVYFVSTTSFTRGATRSEPLVWTTILTTLPLLSFTKVIWLSPTLAKNSVSDLGNISASGRPSEPWPNRCVPRLLILRSTPAST